MPIHECQSQSPSNANPVALLAIRLAIHGMAWVYPVLALLAVYRGWLASYWLSIAINLQ
jgi:hypothetical protein